MSIYLCGSVHASANSYAIERIIKEVLLIKNQQEVNKDGESLINVALIFSENSSNQIFQWKEEIKTIYNNVFYTDDFDSADMIVVAAEECEGIRAEIKDKSAKIIDMVSNGVPYLGAEAGARIASEKAIWEGNAINESRIFYDSNELTEIVLADGLSLVDLTIDTGGNLGTLARSVLLVESGDLSAIINIDSGATLVIPQGDLEILGDSNVWKILADNDKVAVQRILL